MELVLNKFIGPHNVDLLVKYQAHIYVERVNHDGMHKYLFKYVTKGLIMLELDSRLILLLQAHQVTQSIR
jgi:hypothetical protein